MVIHYLKLIHRVFASVESGAKSYELRYNDRNYKVGDVLVLCDYDDERSTYLGPSITRRVTYMLRAEDKGMGEILAPGWCILSIAPLPSVNHEESISDADMLLMSGYWRLMQDTKWHGVSQPEQLHYLTSEFGYSRNQARTVIAIARHCMDCFGELEPKFTDFRVSQLALMSKLSSAQLAKAIISGELKSSMSLREIQSYVEKQML